MGKSVFRESVELEGDVISVMLWVEVDSGVVVVGQAGLTRSITQSDIFEWLYSFLALIEMRHVSLRLPHGNSIVPDAVIRYVLLLMA